ncbi:MAG: hypothetical protein EZS28_044840, partial [Streblomastix strix]
YQGQYFTAEVQILKEEGCDALWQKTLISFEYNGLISSDCVSNRILLPHHLDAPETKMPRQPFSCDSPDEFTKHLREFKYGRIENVDNYMMKKYLTRIGAVYGYMHYFDEETQTIQDKQTYFIGWDIDEHGKEFWITADHIIETRSEGDEQVQDCRLKVGWVPFLSDEQYQDRISGFVLYPGNNTPVYIDGLTYAHVTFSMIITMVLIPLLMLLF